MFVEDISGERKCPLQGTTASNWQGLGLNYKLALYSLPPPLCLPSAKLGVQR